MALLPITDALLVAKQDKGLSFAQIADALGCGEVWVAALFYGQAQATEDEAHKVLSLLGMDASHARTLCGFPNKGSLGETVPTDPFVYRFYEIMQIYGVPMRAVVQEKFGDGIMSAIDFTLEIDKLPDPKGDRVVVTMNGKFLAYKKW